MRKVNNPLSLTIERAARMTRTIQIIQRYALGEPINEITKDYDCGKGTVLRYARAANLPKRPKNFPKEIRETVIAKLKENVPYKIIATALNCSEAYISKVATQENLRRHKTYKGRKI